MSDLISIDKNRQKESCSIEYSGAKLQVDLTFKTVKGEQWGYGESINIPDTCTISHTDDARGKQVLVLDHTGLAHLQKLLARLTGDYGSIRSRRGALMQLDPDDIA